MTVLMRSGDVLVTESGGVVQIRARPTAAIVISVCGIGAAAGFHFVSRALAGPLPDFASFARWASAVLAAVSACLLVAAPCVSAFRRTIIDSRNRVISQGKTSYGFNDVRDVSVHSRNIMDTEILTIDARVRDADVTLVSGHSKKHEAHMREIAQRLRDLIGRESGTLSEDTAVIPTPGSARKLVGTIVTAIGIVMSGTAFLLIPDLALTRPGLRFGFLFWPAGLWIASAGAALIVSGFVPKLPGRGEKALLPLAFIVWAASYFLVCWTPV